MRVDSTVYIDTIREDGFQKMTLNFDPAVNTTSWSNDFESHLHGLPRRIQNLTNLERGVHYQQFSGFGTDYKQTFRCRGIIHPIVEQHGFPGWQRITLMKHFTIPGSTSTSQPAGYSSATGNNINTPPAWTNDNFVIDEDCWAYEGAVLPGGKIILGRWWHPQNDREMVEVGPFIFWEVEQGNLITDSEDGN